MQILVFGDSIAYGCFDKEGGWAWRLRKFLEELHPEKHFFYNLSIPEDESTEEVIKRFEVETKARLSLENNLLIIFAIGINDSEFMNNQNCLRTPPEKFKANIQKLINLAKRFPSKVVFIGLTPVDEQKLDPIPWCPDRSYKQEHIRKFNEVIKSVCRKDKVHFVELFERLNKMDYKKLLEDGCHSNSEGHKVIFEIVKSFLIKNKII